MTTEMSLLNLIQGFVPIQRKVIRALMEKHREVGDWTRVSKWPQEGFVYTDGSDEWTFHRHGKGERFTRSKDQSVIDVHEGMAEHPSAIDAWRLFQYARSMDVAWVAFQGKSYPAQMEQIHSLIPIVCQEAAAKEIKPGMYCWPDESV